MDGTLTLPTLDFDLIREEIGLGDGPILEKMDTLGECERRRVRQILERHEDGAAKTSQLHPGAAEVVAAVRRAGIPAVLMTRNSRRSVEMFRLRHGIEFDLIRTRDDGVVKPSPEPVMEVCRQLGVDPSSAWVVGDFHYDIICGAKAGGITVLLLDAASSRPDWANEADLVIHELSELLDHLGLEATES